MFLLILSKKCFVIIFFLQQIQQQVPPTIFVPSVNATHSPSQNKSRSDSLRELACADTSGIGSSNTSPRQSSRPNSVPSGNGSVIVQTLEEQDMDVMDVKKEQVESPNGKPRTRNYSPSKFSKIREFS